MRKAHNDATDRPFGSQILGVVAIVLGMFEGHLTWPLLFPWHQDSSFSWFDLSVVVLFSLTAVAQVLLGTMLIFIFKNISKRSYKNMLSLTAGLIPIGIILGFMLIIIMFSKLSQLH